MNSTAVQHCASSFIICTGWATEPNCHACYKLLLVAELKFLQDLWLYLLMPVFFMYLLQQSPDCLLPQVQLQSAPRGRCCADLANTNAWVFFQFFFLLWTQSWLQPLWTFLKRVDRKIFVLCQHCFPSYQLASSPPIYQATELVTCTPFATRLKVFWVF